MKIIAHRGASGHAPENTFSAIELGYKSGSNWVEFDIRTTKDNQIILMHDTDVNRTTNGKGLVCDKTMSELTKLDCGSWFSNEFKFEKILTFKKVSKFCKENNITMQVELKPDKGLEQKLVNQLDIDIRKYNILDICLFSSFNHDALRKLRQKISKSNIAVLVEKIPNDYLALINDLKANSIHIDYKQIDRKSINKQINKLHSENKKVRVYTVNNVDDAKYLKSIDIDAIFTDFPKKMIKAII